jgi:hypothetical protein
LRRLRPGPPETVAIRLWLDQQPIHEQTWVANWMIVLAHLDYDSESRDTGVALQVTVSQSPFIIGEELSPLFPFGIAAA